MTKESPDSFSVPGHAARKAQLFTRRAALRQEALGTLRWWDAFVFGMVLLAIAGNLILWWTIGTRDAPIMIALMTLVFASLLYAQLQRQVSSLVKLVEMIDDEQRSGQ